MGSLVSSILDPITGAGATKKAAAAASAQQAQAAKESAAAAAFRPVGMTTRFGSSEFTREIDPATGMPYIAAGSYTAAPEFASLQDRLFGQFGDQLTQAEQLGSMYAPLSGAATSLFNVGQQYLAQSPEQAAQQYIQSQQGLLAGGREQQLAGLRNNLFQRGRSGLATGGTSTGMQSTNPELAAYYNAMAQQDAQIAAQADQMGLQRQAQAAGLYGTGAGLLGTAAQGQVGALSPLQAQLGLSGQIEQMSQQPYQLGLQLGTAAQPGQAQGAQMYNQGMQQAANTQYQGIQQANAMNSQFLSSAIAAASGGMGGGMGGGAGGGGGMFSSLGNAFGNPLTAFTYGTNIGSDQTRQLAAQNAGFGFFR